MMRNVMMALALALVCSSTLFAELPPISPNAWDVSEGETQGTGAILLERTLRIGSLSVEHFYLIRVLSERGKATVEFPGFSPSSKIEGRCVTREGLETKFNTSSDFQTKALLERDQASLNRKVVIPPGLTSDCVVQVAWSEPAFYVAVGGWMDYRVTDQIYSLASRIPSRRVELEIRPNLGWAYDLQVGTTRPKILENRIAIFNDLPAYEWIPFSEDGAKDNPRIVLYQGPQVFMKEASQGEHLFWLAVANGYWRPYYEGKYTFGKVWGGFSEDMRRDLPAGRQEAALEIHRRLMGRIRDIRRLTAEESLALPKKEAERKIDPRDFDTALRTGLTNSDGIFLLYWVLLGQAGIDVKPVRVVDRSIRTFRKKQCNLAQFSATLYMVDEPGRPPIFLDPLRRRTDPSLIHPDYQGTEAMAFIPPGASGSQIELPPGSSAASLAQKLGPGFWGTRVVKIPFQSGEQNLRTTDILIRVNPDRDDISIATKSTGMDEWRERDRWWDLLPEERNRRLKESLAQLDRSIQVERAVVGGMTKSPAEWFTEASRERDASRHLEVQPFPLMRPPLELPGDLPTQRKEPILLPWVGTREIKSVITLPAGYRLGELSEFKRSNAFGDIAWTITPSSGKVPAEVLVCYRVATKRLISEPVAYPQLKEFLSWVRESFERTLVLSRETQ